MSAFPWLFSRGQGTFRFEGLSFQGSATIYKGLSGNVIRAITGEFELVKFVSLLSSIMGRAGSTPDIISYLPDNLIEKILMHLPIQDAVRTGVLSSKWKYIGVNLPQLVFDDTFCRESVRNRKNKLIKTIYQVLLLHRGPILKFTLSLSGLESCSEMDQVIIFVSNNGIQEFTLHIWKGEPYKLPSSLFSSLELTHWNLRSCVLEPPCGFKGFSRLLSLELCEVVVTAEIFSRLLSSCPLLERLKLRSIDGFDYLEIDAPNLVVLHCEGQFSSLYFKDTPRLAKVSISSSVEVKDIVFMEVETPNSVVVFGGLPVIGFLELDYYYVKYMAAGGVPKKLPTTLSHLKILKLDQICFENLDEVSVALCLIRSSPNLEKIRIVGFTDGIAAPGPILELLQVQDSLDVSLNQLREVEMVKISGGSSELEFVEFLLAKSPILEKMLIEPDLDEVFDQGLKILKELTRFRRASPGAEIIFRDPDKK